MKSITTSIKEIKKGNSRLCLSAKRALDRCFECPSYLKCESKKVNHKFEQLQKEKAKAVKEFNEKVNQINQDVERLGE